jgi:hypothetical protein
MRTIDFTNNYGKIHNFKTNEYAKITLEPFQNEILNTFDDNRFVAIEHSRQMGLTTMLTFYTANFLINNKNKNNLLCFTSHDSRSGKEFLNRVRNILTNIDGITFSINNQHNIKLINGNELKVISNIQTLDLENKDNPYEDKESKDKPYSLIIDNASFGKHIDRLITDFIEIDITQILLVSGKRNIDNYFYDNIFNKSDNAFLKKQYRWNLSPRFDTVWYEKIKKSFGDNQDSFLTEIDLINVKPKVNTNKDRVINIRLDDETMNKLSAKLIEKDLSLSEYIRTLIKKDI